MNACLIGYGYWGKILHNYLLKQPELNLIGICDHHYENSENLEELITSKRIDTAFVCLPINTHYEVVKKLLTNGINVFCEKPLCKSYEQTNELLNLAKEKELVLFTDYIYTYSPSILYIKENLNKFGDILSLNMKITQFGNFYKDDNVFEVLGVHMLSVLSFLLDDKIILKNMIASRKNENGKAQSGTLLLSSGNTNATIYCSLISSEKQRKIEIICERGVIIFDMLAEQTVQIIKHDKVDNGWIQSDKIKQTFDEGNNLSAVVTSFCNMVQKKESWSENAMITEKVSFIQSSINNI